MTSNNKLKVIVTGATGMVGEGVVHECLQHPMIGEVLIVNRKPFGMTHPKLKEIVHANFFDLTAIEDQLKGYDACYFCLGVSSVGMKEPEYYKLTYTLTLNFAETLAHLNPDMTFEYISGASTDSTEKGGSMWARVKGKTENDLAKLPFKQVYNFRPGYMHPTPGLRNTNKYYKYITWLYPVLKLVFSNRVSTLAQLGLAMINASVYGYEKQILEVPDIKSLAKR
ncbi:NAD-dependent epimerase/dehydratase family protein [Mucilaginibacter ginsenosidivorans]|uniref:NAD-dependent epimerase/dehydratase family protein n=1 Tax=Mucilaginibacter ginsenosidivorans TaxID=398053 RepID=A0A5B8V2L9_9SPHI|nr:NAD-dependent epimerase/dehydratase family protein [Mucilaginibacter ginsenosidivorans]QEC65399.1 NAD-dependent epimerase/dehydratase family protein [Mucilaginibacter ginsenosidivorans]